MKPVPQTLVISSHLDDAVLSASHVLMNAQCSVLTVFAGPPPDSITLTPWDALTGASSSSERHHERIAENHRALGILGTAGHCLDEPEKQFRRGRSPNTPRISKEIASQLSGVKTLWIPAGIGRDPDHLLARNITLSALQARHTIDVGFYADFPHVARYGWASWITGLPAEKYLRPDMWLASEMEHIGLANKKLKPHVVKLSPAERERKSVAINAYGTQVAALGLDNRRLALRKGALDYEVRWTVPPQVLPLVIGDLTRSSEFAPSEFAPVEDETGPRVGHW